MSSPRIDLWWFRIGAGSEPTSWALALLDVGERSRVRRIADPNSASFFAFRRALRRMVLATYLGLPPGQVTIAETEGGKPILVPQPSPALCFNTSHCGTSGVIAVSTAMPVGVDLELERPIDTARFAERILSPAERIDYQHATPADRAGLMLRAWTAKEALVKGMGLGLDLAAFRQISVPLMADADNWHPAVLGGRFAAQRRWQVCSFSLPVAHPKRTLVSVAAPAAASVRVIDAEARLAPPDPG